MPLVDVIIYKTVEIEHPGHLLSSLNDHMFYLRNIRADLIDEIDKGKIPPFSNDKKSLCFQMIQDSCYLDLSIKRIHG